MSVVQVRAEVEKLPVEMEKCDREMGGCDSHLSCVGGEGRGCGMCGMYGRRMREEGGWSPLAECTVKAKNTKMAKAGHEFQ